MKAIFAHDHPFIKTIAGYHSKGGLPETALQRYVTAFGQLEVIARARPETATTLPPIINPLISFAPVNNIRSLRGIRYFPAVRRVIAQKVGAADVVIARLPSSIGLITAREARRRGIPCLIEVVGHAQETNFMHGSRIGKLAGPIEHFLMRRELRHASHAVYITERYLQKIYPCGGVSFVCPNAIVSPVSPERSRLRPNGSDRVIGLVGSLDVAYKGHGTALQILARLRKDFNLKNVRLEFVGGGDQTGWKSEAERLGISRMVRFVGTLPPGNAVMQWMDELDVLLQPSTTEAQGRSIIEAMSRGRPVVASNVGGIPELLDKEVLFAPNDIDSFSHICRALLTDDGFAARQGRRNLREASRFDADLVEQTRQDIFSQFCAATRPGE